jgi:hypothetical protein
MENKFTDEEMRDNYPAFRDFVYAEMKEYFARHSPPLSSDNLEEVAKAEGGLPLEAFIHELEEGNEA